jgi:hypothetical protein
LLQSPAAQNIHQAGDLLPRIEVSFAHVITRSLIKANLRAGSEQPAAEATIDPKEGTNGRKPERREEPLIRSPGMERWKKQKPSACSRHSLLSQDEKRRASCRSGAPAEYPPHFSGAVIPGNRDWSVESLAPRPSSCPGAVIPLFPTCAVARATPTPLVG